MSLFTKWQKKRIYEKAKERFSPLLTPVADEIAFVVHEDSTDIISGARVTAILPLSGFIELFDDLILHDDFRVERYRSRNRFLEYGIDDSFFDRLVEAGCLEEG